VNGDIVKLSDPRGPPNVSGSSLAESVAHELNNIAASLFGFVELAAEQIDTASPVLRCLGEIRIGVSRVTNLAAVLEALAEVDGSPTKITVGDCLGGTAAAGPGGGWRFNWECAPETIVEADPNRAHRALRTLIHLGKSDSTTGSDPAFTVSRTPSESRCSFCGATLPAGSAKITLIADGLRPSDLEAPGVRQRTGRTFRQLIVSASVHAAHAAAGHVALDAAGSSISVLLRAG
jgi:hypothetical protein